LKKFARGFMLDFTRKRKNGLGNDFVIPIERNISGLQK